MSWLQTIPTCSDVFIYQSALYCEDCAAKIIKQIEKKEIPDEGDSEGFPQGPYSNGGGEADSAQFCASGRACANAALVAGKKIGCPFANPLTDDGIANLHETVRNDLLSAQKFSRKMGRLFCQVWSDYFDKIEIVRMPPKFSKKLPESLVKLVSNYVRGHSSPSVALDPNFYQDTSCAYFVLNRGHDHVVDLLRARVDDEGEFTELQVAYVPMAASQDYDVAKLLSEAAEQGAWD